MKVNSVVKPKPHLHTDKNGNTVKKYFDWLPGGEKHRVTHVKNVAYGQIVKTDRLQRWVNKDCFEVV